METGATAIGRPIVGIAHPEKIAVATQTPLPALWEHMEGIRSHWLIFMLLLDVTLWASP